MVRADSLPDMSLKALRRRYPTLQECIYEALCALTPGQLQFELEQIEDEWAFNLDAIDNPTFATIGSVMTTVTGEDRLIMTKDDLMIAYLRFKELIFFHQAEKQGLMKVDDSGDRLVHYFVSEPNPQLPGSPKAIKRTFSQYLKSR